MKYFPFFSLLILLVFLTSACQSDNTALGRVKSAMAAYQAGNGSEFDGQLTMTLRQAGLQCPGSLQYGCLQLAFKNFTAEQPTAQPSAVFTFFSYEKQTAPNVRMVLMEGNWGGSPAVISCQVFFVLTDGSLWLIDNFDLPEMMTCQQRSAELTKNLFGSDAITPPSP